MVYMGMDWYVQNEVKFIGGISIFGSKLGKYLYWLFSVDWDVDLIDKLKVCVSFGVNIGCFGFDQMLGGMQLNVDLVCYNVVGLGFVGDLVLKLLKFKNLDLLVEYYYVKLFYVVFGVFYKKVMDFISMMIVSIMFVGLNQLVIGMYYQVVLVFGILVDWLDLIWNYIFIQYNGQLGVIQIGFVVGILQGDILGIVLGMQLLVFNIMSYKNGVGDNIKGLEFNFQYLFGNSGFGVLGNYIYVKSGLKFNNNIDSMGLQVGLVGISNFVNFVGFFENDVWFVCGVYNWCGQFFVVCIDGVGNNLVYIEFYGQVDFFIGYKFGKNLMLQVDLLNLNDGYICQYGCMQEQVVFVLQIGCCYLIGVCYCF